ncbi:NRDE family protein [Lysobacter auxotrophicus]|uniref:NRDE family protein n=1 Tax=Lysobacter auxotrophicus TaxID=2992573 RepID=A0ABN6UIV8_9GAMM|nr:NRDE family protein [Lysobacter auxotrophicus]BDU16210.1 NRDE family protein [Lysobacter auxotrophicus]
MCLIALSWKQHSRYRLALIANRDEAHDRPAAPAGVDPVDPTLYGGRDLLAGGSWLLASTRGRLAAVTNVRAGAAEGPMPRSRGALVREFAAGDGEVGALADLASQAAGFGRFNLLAFDGVRLAFASNHPDFRTYDVTPGLHAMSNGDFDAPWPKSGHATRALERWLASPAAHAGRTGDDDDLAPLFEALADTTPAPDDTLPDTGVGLPLERLLSPPFVRGERYGTRCSSIVLVEDARLTFVEQSYGPNGVRLGRTRASFAIG